MMQKRTMSTAFSIIICTHNPNEEIICKLLNAILSFDVASPQHEVIIVDNNSIPALDDKLFLRDFLVKKEWSALIQEIKPGLTSARIAGIKAAQYDWLIFFDDDNEPASNYLAGAEKVIEQYPQAGAWGPGQINVEYIGKSDEWLNNNKLIFQERHDTELKLSKEQHWQACYPFGTGMIIRKSIADEYAKRVIEARYTLSDRQGKSLSSGGDVQMVLTAVQMGYEAGVIPVLRLNHFIDTDKTSFIYLKRLFYGTASAYVKAYNQVFQDNTIPVSAPKNIKVLRIIWHYFRQIQKEKDSKTQILVLIRKLGELNAGLEYNSNLKKPLALKLFERSVL
jgi:glycosyltransferase involved in cell wall biosynthesis